jgi:ribosomal protein S18 acetylase RimI-like enzyme
LNAAYSDYSVPTHLSIPSFDRLVAREAIRLEVSAAALADGQIVGMGLLGVRGRRAWIGGMGVLPEHRHQGIGRQVMTYLLDQARGMGIEHVQLEVITKNYPAFGLYCSMGFETSRELLVLSGDRHRFKTLRPKGLLGIQIEPATGAALLAQLPDRLAAAAPWQRTPESLWQMRDSLDGFCARDAGSFVQGLCLWSGDNRQAGIYALSGNTGEIVEMLLSRLLTYLPLAHFSYLNVPCDDPAMPILLSAGFQETVHQYEMHRDLV